MGLIRKVPNKNGDRLVPRVVVRGRETTRAGKHGDDKRKAVLDELAADAQRHGLGY